MYTQIIYPSVPLRPFVHHYWVMKTEGWTMEMNIMPKGCMKWMFHRQHPLIVNGIVNTSMVGTVCGCYNSATHVRSDGATYLLFVFFKPYAMKMVMGMPCKHFFDSNIDMDDLENPGFKVLKRQVLESASDSLAIDYIEKFILRQLECYYDEYSVRRIFSVCDEMERRPFLDVKHLADLACLGERQFRRIYLENVGITPKRMLCIYRFIKATQMLQHSLSRDFSSIIVQLGYTDHSHFNKDFRKIAGMSPSEYLTHIELLRQNLVLDGYQSYHQ